MQQLQRLIVECSFVSEKQPPEVFSNKVGIKNFAKFTGRLRSAPLLRKRLRHMYFPVNFVNFLRAAFLRSNSRQLLLDLRNIVSSNGNFVRITNLSKKEKRKKKREKEIT